jgi:hypothetical protein
MNSRSKTFALLFILMFLLPLVTIQLAVVKADPFDVILPSLDIVYPPYPPNRFENSTIDLEIIVRLVEGSSKPSNVSYRLDDGQLVSATNFTLQDVRYFDQNFTSCTVRAKLENLSEGNHTIEAYTMGMHTSRTFRVNSYYHPTVITILSPTNQTYSQKVPLVFSVNLPIKSAHYYLFRQQGNGVFERFFEGNITIDNLKDGDYLLHLYVTTENGEETTSANFSVINTSSITSLRIDFLLIAIPIVMLLLGVGLLLYRRHRKNANLKQ